MHIERIKAVHAAHSMTVLPIKVGQMLELHEHIWDGSNKRTRKFKALVLGVKKPQSSDGTFTVRGVSAGVVVEKIYPLSFTGFQKLILLDLYKVRRSKIYFMRDKVWKSARLKSILPVSERGKDLI